jgi:hypothetical protein
MRSECQFLDVQDPDDNRPLAKVLVRVKWGLVKGDRQPGAGEQSL